MSRTHRLVRAAAALGAAAMLAGCALMTPIQTADVYAAGDGVRVEVADGIRVENLMVLASEEGGEGNVYGALVNDTMEEVDVELLIADGGIGLTLDPRQSLLLGVDEPVVIPSVPVAPGSLLDVTLSAAGQGTVPASVPVLDDTLPQYADLVP